MAVVLTTRVSLPALLAQLSAAAAPPAARPR
jgi:hypothetical protein